MVRWIPFALVALMYHLMFNPIKHTVILLLALLVGAITGYAIKLADQEDDHEQN